MRGGLSAQVLAGLLDALPAHVGVIDAKGVIVAVNKPWKEFAAANGMMFEHAGIGSNYIDICEAATGPEAATASRIAQGIRAVIARELTGFEAEYTWHSPARRRWFRLYVTPIALGTGNGAMATHIDVTDRALAEEDLKATQDAQFNLARQLRKEQKELAAARALARVGTWEMDLETQAVKWSAETYAIFEVDQAGFVPTYPLFLDFVHPDDRDGVDRTFLPSTATRDIQTVDHRIVLPDGRIKYLTETWQTVVDERGVPVRALGTCQDITEREIANRKLRESEAKLRRSQEIFSTAERVASIGSVALDFRTGLWEWSDEAYRIYGLDRAEFVPSLETFPALIHPDDREVLLGAIPRARQGITPESLEYRIRRPDGEERLLRRVATLARGPNGEVLGIVGTLQDITDIRAAEKENALLQEQLRQGQRLEAVGKMTGGIAHDFNNLLTVILGNTDVLARNLPQKSPLYEMVELTRMAAERGAQLTNRLLAFSRRQPLNPRATNVNDLIAGMEGLLRRALGEQIDLSIVAGSGLWTCMVDASQLENALLNLAVNSRDAMPAGGRLTIETSNAALGERQGEPPGDKAEAPVCPQGAYILIAVTDTGTGMTEETRQRAFDPFFTTKDVGKGSGLGLSMVYGFVRQSRGLVEIASRIGKGTSVKLFLPRADEQPVREGEPPAEQSALGGNESILVVEDDDLVRRQAMVNLRALGYRVTGARDGFEALEILKAGERFDLLFTDVVMPRGMNGRQLAEAAARIHPHLPVLFTSGYAQSAIIQDGRLKQGLSLLPKPYHSADLARKVRLVLDAKTAGGRT